MRVTARGWGRNMGRTVLADFELSDLVLNRDQNQTLWWGRPSLFWTATNTEVHWTAEMRMGGKYRLEIEFSELDVVRLFRGRYGTVLDVDLLDKYGLTVSEELKKRILGSVKFADLTVADLVGMNSKPSDEGVQETPEPQRSRFRKV
jgi:hypothetical protein